MERLHELAESGTTAELRKYIETTGIEINERNFIDDTPLMKAARVGNIQNVKFLLSFNNCVVGAINRNKQNAAMMAAEKGHRSLVELLLDTGAIDINSQDINGKTLFMHACESCCYELARMIMNHGEFKAEMCDHNGVTNLMYAAENFHYKFYDSLVSLGANVNATTDQGNRVEDYIYKYETALCDEEDDYMEHFNAWINGDVWY